MAFLLSHVLSIYREIICNCRTHIQIICRFVAKFLESFHFLIGCNCLCKVIRNDVLGVCNEWKQTNKDRESQRRTQNCTPTIIHICLYLCHLLHSNSAQIYEGRVRVIGLLFVLDNVSLYLYLFHWTVNDASNWLEVHVKLHFSIPGPIQCQVIVILLFLCGMIITDYLLRWKELVKR